MEGEGKFDTGPGGVIGGRVVRPLSLMRGESYRLCNTFELGLFE